MSATDIAAWWGAGIATFVALFEFFRWWQSRATELRISASTNMQEFLPGSGLQDGRFVSVEINNVGDRTTTLTNFGGFHYKSWWQERLNKVTQAFVILDPTPGVIPCELAPGQMWRGRMQQTEQVESWSRNGRLYIAVYHSLSKKAQLTRVIIPVQDDP
ncbi:MAG TPA: hypothetical protein PKH39_10275 [Woeseiaceae bacterium]|nr:hypothetical protein [Woeseiaceae bacterium]